MKKLIFFSIVISIVFSANLASGRVKNIQLKSGARAILYIPKNYDYKVNKQKYYPLLVALHGMGEYSELSIERWQEVAEKLNMILICPRASSYFIGYTRYPIDDRKYISQLWDYVNRHYRVSRKKSVVVGFSKGGHIAVEMGLIYPLKFRNVICMFGFFDNRHRSIVTQNAARNKNMYKYSKFYFITGQGDLSQSASTVGHNLLKKLKIKTEITVYPELRHGVPEDIEEQISSYVLNK